MCVSSQLELERNSVASIQNDMKQWNDRMQAAIQDKEKAEQELKQFEKQKADLMAQLNNVSSTQIVHFTGSGFSCSLVFFSVSYYTQNSQSLNK